MNTENNGTVNISQAEAQETQSGEVYSWENVLENERSYVPFVDIYETNDEFVLTANIPGVNKEDVKLKLEENSLTIFGKINFKEKLNRKYLLNETGIGNYYRKFRISDTIDQSKIEAAYQNGQLTVKLPKSDKVKPRNININ